MNCAICTKETGEIMAFIRNCYRRGNNFTGDSTVQKRDMSNVDVIWTNDDVTRKWKEIKIKRNGEII